MNLSQWFREQLKASGAGFVWAVEQLPPERLFIPHPRFPEDWPVARHVFHMLNYEKKIALPFMRYWLGEPLPKDAKGNQDAEQREWEKSHDIEGLLAQFRATRAEQIILLAEYSEAMWEEIRETIWGPVSLRWVVTKTYQHTAEHTHDVLRTMLFWDMLNTPQTTEGE